MDYVVGLLANLGDIAAHAEDDQVDRLSHRYTTFFLIVFAILVSTKQYVGDPITCWVPAQFTHNHEEYTNKVCWVTNTYYLPFEEMKIPDDPESRQNISYYQWIPMILICQALLFYIPFIVWKILNKRSGLNVKMTIDAGVTWSQSPLGEARERSLRYMVHHVDSYLSTRRQVSTNCWSNFKRLISQKCIIFCGVSYGNYLTCCYFAMKFLYIMNSIGQIFMLDMFLDTDYHMFGVKVVMNLFQGRDWRTSVRFPRVTLCDFQVRSLANIHQHTVQCVLPINIFNEKIFVFIWFWFVLVAVVTILSFIHWFFRFMSTSSQKRYIKQELLAFCNLQSYSRRDIKKLIHGFSNEYLRQDGILILRLLMKNVGDQVAAELLARLWEVYVKEQGVQSIARIQATSPGGRAQYHTVNMENTASVDSE